MGAANPFSRVKKVKVAQRETKSALTTAIQERRRNSHAYYIKKFVDLKGDDPNDLLREVDTVEKAKLGPQTKKVTIKKVPKFTRIGNKVLHGNFRELKTQVVMHVNTINHKYKDASHYNSTLLHFVCQECYLPMLEFMVDPRNRLDMDKDLVLELDLENDKGRTPLILCFTPPVSSFLGQKYGLTKDGNARAEKIEYVEDMEDGTNTLATDWLQPGGPKERQQCIKILCEIGANVNFTDFHGFTSLHLASIWGWVNSVEDLIRAKADVNAMTVMCRTPLMFAIENDHVKCVELLLTMTVFDLEDEFADVEPDGSTQQLNINAADTDGRTAMTMALEKGETEEGLMILQRLLEFGAEMDMEVKLSDEVWKGKATDAITIACYNQSVKQVMLLLDFGCKRKEAAFALLTGDALSAVRKRLNIDDSEAEEEKARLEKEHRARMMAQQSPALAAQLLAGRSRGYKNQSPIGMWVEYRDKITTKPFYYNLVTRESRKEIPPDFKPDPSRPVKDAIFGANFYH